MKSLLFLRDATIEERDAQIAYHEARVAALLEQVRLMRHTLYAASSEQSSGQLSLFDEADVLAAEPVDAEAADDVAPPLPKPAASVRRCRPICRVSRLCMS